MKKINPPTREKYLPVIQNSNIKEGYSPVKMADLSSKKVQELQLKPYDHENRSNSKHKQISCADIKEMTDQVTKMNNHINEIMSKYKIKQNKHEIILNDEETPLTVQNYHYTKETKCSSNKDLFQCCVNTTDKNSYINTLPENSINTIENNNYSVIEKQQMQISNSKIPNNYQTKNYSRNNPSNFKPSNATEFISNKKLINGYTETNKLNYSRLPYLPSSKLSYLPSVNEYSRNNNNQISYIPQTINNDLIHHVNSIMLTNNQNRELFAIQNQVGVNRENSYKQREYSKQVVYKKINKIEKPQANYSLIHGAVNSGYHYNNLACNPSNGIQGLGNIKRKDNSLNKYIGGAGIFQKNDAYDSFGI